jgi:hypothetical protein
LKFTQPQKLFDSAEDIDEELALATSAFCEDEVEINSENSGL